MNRRALQAGTCLALALVASSCTARKHSGVSAETAGFSSGVLRPDPATGSTSITVVLPDAALDPTTCRYLWRRNGDVIAGANGQTLDPSNFHKGDRISVAVEMPETPNGERRPFLAEVYVVNTPPRVTRVTLATQIGSAGAELAAHVDCVDVDGDTPEFAYHWYRNEHLVAGQTGSSLPEAAYTSGDRIAVEVVARDDQSASLPMRSEAPTLDDRPPQFTSQPMAPHADDVTFSYQATAADPDGDPLQFTLVSGPDGMQVDEHGRVTWPLPPQALRRGDYAVKLRVTDLKGGEATQDFTIHLTP